MMVPLANKYHPNILLSIKSPHPALNLQCISKSDSVTKYPVIKEVAIQMQMQVDSQHHSLLWTDHPLSIK